MKPIDFFKLQAKNLHRDYKTKTSSLDELVDEYKPKYFDIDMLALDYDFDEENFTLMNAQHIIARLAGFPKWTNMLKATDVELELSKLLFDNMHKISAEEWDDYLRYTQNDNNVIFDADSKLEIFKVVFATIDSHQSMYTDYRMISSQKGVETQEKANQVNRESGPKIVSLPLAGQDRLDFIDVANAVFETVLLTMEPEHPKIVRQLWKPDFYIDNDLLQKDMLPIDRNYALSLIEAFLVHHVLDLIIQADDIAMSAN